MAFNRRAMAKMHRERQSGIIRFFHSERIKVLSLKAICVSLCSPPSIYHVTCKINSGISFWEATPRSENYTERISVSKELYSNQEAVCTVAHDDLEFTVICLDYVMRPYSQTHSPPLVNVASRRISFPHFNLNFRLKRLDSICSKRAQRHNFVPL